MEPLRQRVIASCHVGPLTLAETMFYIHHRMQVVGWNGPPVFDEAAVERIFAFTGGNPRRINLLCTRLLMSAFVESKTLVDAARVQVMARDLGR
jgi:type II secretory pathway predicted ATPase ExeA